MRLSRDKKIFLAKRIAQMVVSEWVPKGQFGKLGNLDCSVCQGQVGSLEFMYITPFSRIPGARAPYGLDLWTEQKKVFSLWWDPPQIMRFDYGPWMNLVVEDSYPAIQEIAVLLQKHEWLIPHVHDMVRTLKTQKTSKEDSYENHH